MPYTSDGFEWEVPARVVSVLDGATFVADADLGWGVRVMTVVQVEGLEVDAVESAPGMDARKLAQRLLRHADVVLRAKRMSPRTDLSLPGVVAEVTYAPLQEPRGEQGSFKAAMLASGFARARDGG